MVRQQHDLSTSCLRALAVTAAVLTIHGCSPEFSSSKEGEVAIEPAPEPIDGTVTPISQLPFIDATTNAQLLAELLDSPTALGETTALQVRLPPPRNQELAESLVRVIGEPDDPHVLFRSDELVELGMLQSSPGPALHVVHPDLPAAADERLAPSKRGSPRCSQRAAGGGCSVRSSAG